MDPPGCKIVLIPESLMVSMLSRKGKNASEARTPPYTFSPPFFRAICTASTLLT